MRETKTAFIKYDKIKCSLGLVIGLFIMLGFGLCWAAWVKAIPFIALFALVGSIKLRVDKVFLNCFLYMLWLGVCMLALLFFAWHGLFPNISELLVLIKDFSYPSSFAFNLAIIIIAFLLVFSLSGRPRFSIIAVSFVLSGLVVTNNYIYRFRGKEFIFSDFFAAKTAMNVSGNYDMRPEMHILIFLAVIALLLFAGFCLPELELGRKLKLRLCALTSACILSAAVYTGSSDKNLITWDWDGSLINGYYLNFYFSIRDYFVDKPEGYSKDSIGQLENEYDSTTYGQPSQQPNIIVIMNESFADLSVLGTLPPTNTPVIPFFESLRESTLSGYALTSVYGGTTANSEFEFLTGQSMQFFPKGSTPYQQYLIDDTYALPQFLSSIGYHCMATHPYLESGWNRTNVYPLLGFDSVSFISDYPQENLIREYVSDREMYEYVFKAAKNCEEPLFLFGITMQNHGGYSYSGDNFQNSISITNSDYPDVEQYLSLLNYSDKALEALISSLQDFEEETVVLFFGDHLPKLNQSFYETVAGGPFDTLDKQMLQYTVPFFIWANYDIPTENIECTSLNYLGRYLLEAANIDLPPFYLFLKDLEQEIPALNALGFYSKTQKCFVPIEAASWEESLWLNNCAILQFNSVFDSSGRSEIFFRLP